VIKRALDIILAVLGLTVLLPLLAAAAVAVRLDGPGPVLFRQSRVGRHGHSFAILKFRTMRPLPEGMDGGAVEQRVTRWGRLLRRTKIDELPQLLNVLAGDMSIVGPRPELASYVELWSCADRALVLSARPGLTDLASIAYHREEQLLAAQANPEEHYRRVIVPRKLRLCRFYVRRASTALDFWLIGQTIAVLLGIPVRLGRLVPAPASETGRTAGSPAG
jgi:lipopolysaccharide/colanic/teichoic acid biosynthesis glycosyltransferase